MAQFFLNTLVVTIEELVPVFYSKDSLQQEIWRCRNKDYGIKKVQKGGNGRKMLIAFDSLPQYIQDAIGDPRKVSNPLDMFYKTDKSACEFFNSYRLDDNSGLSLKLIEEYITNASVLRAAILLREARMHERKTKGASCKGIMSSLCSDVARFNQSLKANHSVQHTLPHSEKRFKETFNDFSILENNKYNYSCLVSGRLRNENRKLVTDQLLQLLNDLFATQSHKPTKVEVARQYSAFLSGDLEVINNETGELYQPSQFVSISESTITSYLNKWEEKIATYKIRSGDRQRYMGNFKPYHSLEKPQYAGSIISVDDRQPPFHYDAQKNRVWFYNGIDLGSEAFICWVHGKSKDGIITEFYQQLVRNYHEWGVNIPAEIEAESNLNSSFVNTFLREGAMFENVRIEANNARGKRIERYFGSLRYGSEKQREGWLARPHARSESNQAGSQQAPVIPYNTIVQNSLRDIEDWNNSPHSVHTDKSRWDVFMEMQNPNLRPTNWNAILPHLGYKTQTTCGLNGIINLNNKEYLLGLDGEVSTGDQLITSMKHIAGRPIDVYWLDGNDGEVIRALVFLRNQDKRICEAVIKPKYNRATIERTTKDKKNYELMSSYVATIERYAREKSSQVGGLTIHDHRDKRINTGFSIPQIKKYEGSETETERMPDLPEESEVEVTPTIKRGLGDRF